MKFQSKAHQLKAELDQLKPLDPDVLQRVNSKLKLDWTYHSNKIEGNSLTFGETKSLLLHNITAQGKPLRDHLEITQHNEAIEYILDIVKGDEQSRPLTEQFIKELHKILLKESYYSPAKSLDGTPTRKKIEVGQYKSTENHVETSTGEIFYFASVAETPARMNDLLDWYRLEIEKDEIDPIVLAALFHYRFVRIHPFDDGNGRMARVLMNFILMKFGFPPAVITHEDRQRYYQVLQMADGDNLQPFFEFIEECVCYSLDLMIKAAQGISISSLQDLEKELAILEMNVRRKQEVRLQTQSEFPKWRMNNCLALFTTIISSIRKFGSYYSESYFEYSCDGTHDSIDNNISKGKKNLIKILLDDIPGEAENVFSRNYFKIRYEQFSLDGIAKFDHVEFYEFRLLENDMLVQFSIRDSFMEIFNEKYSLDSNWNEDEIKKIGESILKAHLDRIKVQTN